MNTYADLVELADSGDTEGRLANRGGIWRQVPVENAPGVTVFSSKSTTWCYPVEDLRSDERLRFAIRMTAAGRALSAAKERGDENKALRWRGILDGLEAHRPAPRNA